MINLASDHEWEFEASVSGVVYAETEEEAEQLVKTKLFAACSSVSIDYLYSVDYEDAWDDELAEGDEDD